MKLVDAVDMMVKIIKKPTTYAGESLTLLLNFAKVGVGNESVHKHTDTHICLAEAGLSFLICFILQCVIRFQCFSVC